MGPQPETIVAHDDEFPAGAVVPPIFQTSLFTFPSYEELEAAFAGKTRRPIYSRGDNPTVQVFEAKLAALEGPRRRARLRVAWRRSARPS